MLGTMSSEHAIEVCVCVLIGEEWTTRQTSLILLRLLLSLANVLETTECWMRWTHTAGTIAGKVKLGWTTVADNRTSRGKCPVRAHHLEHICFINFTSLGVLPPSLHRPPSS